MTAATPTPQAEPRVELSKLYVKDISLQIPQGSKAFRLEWQPEINFEVQTTATPLQEADHFEVAVRIKCTNTCKGEVAFVAEVLQAGLFNVTGLEKEVLARTLATFCPNLLYPFVREAVGDLVVRAGFPQLNLSAVNFEQMYEQSLANKPTLQ
jgi:preprotein translocase subunit SecB